MNKLCLFALLVAVVSANLAVDIDNLVLTRNTFKCLTSQNVSKVILKISNEMGHINQDFLNGFIFAKDGGISTVDAIVMVNDTFIPTEISAKVADAIPSGFDGTVWLRVLNAPQLWTRDMNKRISYLGDLVASFNQSGLKVGISADAITWVSVFGSQRASSENLKFASVWYVNDDNIRSFADFRYASFGNWTQPALKSFQKSTFICGTSTASNNYYEAESMKIFKRFLQ